MRERETQHKKWGGGEYGRVSSKKKEKLNYSGGRKKSRQKIKAEGNGGCKRKRNIKYKSKKLTKRTEMEKKKKKV